MGGRGVIVVLLACSMLLSPAMGSARKPLQAAAPQAAQPSASDYLTTLASRLDPPLLQTILAQTPERQAILLNSTDVDYLLYAHGLECETAETIMWAAYGHGLSNVTTPGPPSIGGRKANLTADVQKMMEELALVQAWHVETLRQALGNYSQPCPQLAPGPGYAAIMDRAFNRTLDPPFDAFANDINLLLASLYVFDFGTGAYLYAVETAPFLQPSGLLPVAVTNAILPLASKILMVEGHIAAMVRTLLFALYREEVVKPYNFTVKEAVDALTALRRQVNQGPYYLANGTMRFGELPAIADFGLVVPYTPEDLVLITPPGILNMNVAAASGPSLPNLTAGALQNAPWKYGPNMRSNIMESQQGLGYARNPFQPLQVLYGNVTGTPARLLPLGTPGRIT